MKPLERQLATLAGQPVDHMVSVAKVHEALGPRVASGSNLDPVTDILRGNPDFIRAKLERCYQEAAIPSS